MNQEPTATLADKAETVRDEKVARILADFDQGLARIRGQFRPREEDVLLVSAEYLRKVHACRRREQNRQIARTAARLSAAGVR